MPFRRSRRNLDRRHTNNNRFLLQGMFEFSDRQSPIGLLDPPLQRRRHSINSATSSCRSVHPYIPLYVQLHEHCTLQVRWEAESESESESGSGLELKAACSSNRYTVCQGHSRIYKFVDYYKYSRGPTRNPDVR